MIHSFVSILIVFALVSCAATKTPYVSGDTEPGDLPPSPRYGAMMMALRDELPHHADTTEFFLCQSREQVAALQRDLPGFTLKHASETYNTIPPMKGWPASFSRRISDDQAATRVIIDIESETHDKITTKITIGCRFPGGRSEIIYTFHRAGSSWKLLRREELPQMRI
jgi:hypothetical protein